MNKLLILVWSPAVISLISYLVVLFNRYLYSTDNITLQTAVPIEAGLFGLSVILWFISFVLFLVSMFKRQFKVLPHFMLSFIFYCIGFALAGATSTAFLYAT